MRADHSFFFNQDNSLPLGVSRQKHHIEKHSIWIYLFRIFPYPSCSLFSNEHTINVLAMFALIADMFLFKLEDGDFLHIYNYNNGRLKLLC